MGTSSHTSMYFSVSRFDRPLKGRFFALKMSQTASRFKAFAPRPYTVSNYDANAMAVYPLGKQQGLPHEVPSNRTESSLLLA